MIQTEFKSQPVPPRRLDLGGGLPEVSAGDPDADWGSLSPASGKRQDERIVEGRLRDGAFASSERVEGLAP